jgi:transketolase C-terminal domain/subunit
MPAKTFIEAIRETIVDEMRRDESVIVLGEDVGKKGGVFLATDGLWSEFGEDRVIDTPLTESMIIGTSIGAAVNGLRPVAEIQFADFIHPAFNQLVSEAARMRYRSNNGYGVPMTVRAPYGGGVHGALYHSQSVEAFYAHVPGLKVVVPSTPYDAKGLLRSSIRNDDPVLFFEHKKMYRSVRGDVPDGDYTVPLGKAAVTRQGTKLTVIAYGLMAIGSAGSGPRSPRSSARKPSTTWMGRSHGSPARTCRVCRTTTSSKSGSWSTRRRSSTGSASSPRTEPPRVDAAELEAELRRILAPYENRLVGGQIYGLWVLRRSDAKNHDWFAGVRPGKGTASSCSCR